MFNDNECVMIYVQDYHHFIIYNEKHNPIL